MVNNSRERKLNKMKWLILLIVLYPTILYSAPQIEQYRVEKASTTRVIVSSSSKSYFGYTVGRLKIEILNPFSNSDRVYFGFNSATNLPVDGVDLEPGQSWWTLNYSSGIYFQCGVGISTQPIKIIEHLKKP